VREAVKQISRSDDSYVLTEVIDLNTQQLKAQWFIDMAVLWYLGTYCLRPRLSGNSDGGAT